VNIKRISATSVTKYSLCPRQWQFSYELKLLTLPCQAFTIGSAYHKYVELFHKNKSTEQIMNHLKPTLNKDEFIEVCQMGRKYEDNPIRGKVSCLELNFSYAIEGIPVPLFGYIDRLDENKIVEYKTSSFDYKQSDIETLQSKIYTYAIWRYYNKIFPVVYSVMNKKKVNKPSYKPQRLEIKYTEEDMLNLEDTLRAFYQNVKDKKFDPCPGKHCYWCPWNKRALGNCDKSI